MTEITHTSDEIEAEADGMAAYAFAIANPDPNDPTWPLPSFDARDWASAFCATFPGQDEELMIGWFANALMRGFDEANYRNARPCHPAVGGPTG